MQIAHAIEALQGRDPPRSSASATSTASTAATAWSSPRCSTAPATFTPQSVAVTFDPHPAHVLHTASRLPLITPLAEKLELLAATGLDLTLVLPFTDALRQWSARQFAERVLRDGLHAVEVHEGETFRFGHNAAADISSLSDLGRDLGFAVRAYEPCIVRGSAISSSRIRALIAAGNMHQARTLLGRSFFHPQHACLGPRGYGTKYAVPHHQTSPLMTSSYPPTGFYISTLKIGDAQHFRGVTNIGNRPTFGVDSFAVETHLFDFEPLALDDSTPLELTFLKRLRAEQKIRIARSPTNADRL